MVLTHKIIFHQIDHEASKLFKFSRRPGLRRSSIRLLHQTGRTRRRRNSFACRVVKYWNRLPLALASVQDHLAFKRQLDTYIYTYFLLLSLFSPQYCLFWAICPFPIIKYIHTICLPNGALQIFFFFFFFFFFYTSDCSRFLFIRGISRLEKVHQQLRMSSRGEIPYYLGTTKHSFCFDSFGKVCCHRLK